MADSAIVPAFSSKLNLSPIEQVNFRGQEPWGRWLLGHEAKLTFTSATAQQVELDFNLTLPYEGQWVKLMLNGKTIFRSTRPAQAPGEFKSLLLMNLQEGRNTLEVITNRSNLDGVSKPFAAKDTSDISVGLNRLDFGPTQIQAQTLYGPQPSSFIGPVYQSASVQGLEKVFEQPGPLTVQYKLLRRFKKQGFTFELDGQPVYRLPAEQPGNLLIGQFDLPASTLSKAEVHVLKISSQPVSSLAQAFVTTAQDSPDVQFYVQQLQLKPTASDLQTNLLAVGSLALVLGALIWFLLFRHQRS